MHRSSFLLLSLVVLHYILLVVWLSSSNDLISKLQGDFFVCFVLFWFCFLGHAAQPVTKLCPNNSLKLLSICTFHKKKIHVEVQRQIKVLIKWDIFCSVDVCDVQPLRVSDGFCVPPFYATWAPCPLQRWRKGSGDRWTKTSSFRVNDACPRISK